MKYGAYIRKYAGYSMEEYRALIYEVGVAFLATMEENETRIAELERSYIFWNWYTRQFDRLTRQFVIDATMENIQAVSAAVIRPIYENYVRTLTITEAGYDNYLYCLNNSIFKTGKLQERQVAS
jgi:hypothetical protein